jgi:hypothetical protein
MPLYGGTVDTHDTSESYGWVYRYDRDTGTWAEAEWEDGAITKIVADPYFKDVFFVACRHVNGDIPLFQMGTYLGGEPAVFGLATLWQPMTAAEQENFAIMDIQVVPISEHGREVCLTLRTPKSNAQGIDHTVVKRWQFNLTAGRHRLTFDASGFPSGVYLCRLEAGEMAQTRKIVLVK